MITTRGAVFFNLIFLLLFILFVSAFSGNSKAEIDIKRIDLSHIEISFQTPEMQLNSVELNSRQFDEINSETSGFWGEPGGPILPSWSRWIEIPEGCMPVLDFDLGEEATYHDVVLKPFPESQSENSNFNSETHISLSLYEIDQFHPVTQIQISEIIWIGNSQKALLDITPYQYNSAKKQLKVYNSISLDVKFLPNPDAAGPSDKILAPVYSEMSRALGEKAYPERDDPELRQDNLGHYVVVIPNEELIEEAGGLLDLIEWKKRKGFLVTIANLDEIGNRSEELGEYLQNAWDEWENPPTYVLLIGDISGNVRVPTFDDRVGGVGQSWHASDNPYVQWEGERDLDLWKTEGFVGRLSAVSQAQVDQISLKILRYERDPFVEEQWIEGAVLIADGVHSCITTNQAVREILQGSGYNRDNIHENYAEWHQGQHPNVNDIRDGVNGGVGFVNFRGYQTWGGVYYNMIHQYNNGAMMPVVTGMVCGTNDYTNAFMDTQPESRGEAWIRAWQGGPRGGVACFGPTDLYTHTWFNNTMDGEFYNSLFNKDVYTLGALCELSKLSLYRNYPSLRSLGNGTSIGYYFYAYVLLGDPGMQVWTTTPEEIQVDFIAEKAVGSSTVSATVLTMGEDPDPVPGAYVHIYIEMEDEELHYGAYTDSEGSVMLIIDPLNEGEYHLTITGPNLIPIQESFEVIQAPVYSAISEVNIDDNNEDGSRGNDNGIINPGEIIELSIPLINTGRNRADGFAVQLSTNSPWVDVTRDEINYPAADADEEVEGENSFLIEINPTIPDSASIVLDLVITSGESQWQESFNLEISGYSFSIVDYTFSNGELEPGEEDNLIFTIENNGQMDSEALSARLFCLNPKIQLSEAESVFGGIASGEQNTNSQYPFEILAGINSFPRSEMHLGMLLFDENGIQDSLTISITLGGPFENAPQGPTEYGYWAFDSRDTTDNMNPEFDWIDGTENLRLTDNNDSETYLGTGGSRVIIDELPFEFIYYGQAYSEMTVGSNGWCAFGRSDQVSWNNQEIGSGLAPPAMLCPYWTDLWSGRVFTRYDEENARFVIEWRNFDERGHNDLTFAVHLYDPNTVVTATGDGEIFFLYGSGYSASPGRDLPGEAVTIGFSSPDRRDGMTITHANNWDPRTDDLEDDMAIRITTGPLMERSVVFGNVRNLETEQLMEGVRVMLEGTGFHGISDRDGNYRIEEAPVGTYTVSAQKRHFNNMDEADIQIVEDEEVEVNFLMTYPTFNINIEDIRIGVLADSSWQHGWAIWNEGNGPLDYEIILDYEVDPPEQDAPWDPVFQYMVGDSVGDSYLLGVAFDGELFYISGPVQRNEYPHKIYTFDKEGNFDHDFDQYNIDSSSSRGYSEMDFNGENLLAVESSRILEITREGEFVDSIDAIYNPTNTVAWSPDRQSIFTKFQTATSFYELDTDGNLLNEYHTGEARLYSFGLTWFPEDEDGYPLYILSKNRYPEEIGGTKFQLTKLDPETGDFRHVKYFFYPGMDGIDTPQGCLITKYWDPLLWTFVVLVNRAGRDFLIGFELEPNLTWISYEPHSGSVPPDERQNFIMNFNSAGLPEDDYYIELNLFHNAVGDEYNIPVYFTVGEVGSIGDSEEIPEQIGLKPAYPNPFNSSTRLNFSIAEMSNVSFTLFDLKGRMVKEIVNDKFVIGNHTITYSANGLPSGIYLIQMKTKNFTATQKLILLK